MTLATLSGYRLKKTHVPALQDVPRVLRRWIVERAIVTIKVARRVALRDKGSRRVMISSNCHPERHRRRVALAGCFQS